MLESNLSARIAGPLPQANWRGLVSAQPAVSDQHAYQHGCDSLRHGPADHGCFSAVILAIALRGDRAIGNDNQSARFTQPFFCKEIIHLTRDIRARRPCIFCYRSQGLFSQWLLDR